ncbi:MAG TPA: alkaline phosphatase family protein [Bryobacteraceae bacterium]|nr:alkaline phosphatase family protein [Bryobacteraceae bacterium]
MMSPFLAYIGPGAGFAFLGSFLSLLVSFLLTAFSFLALPFRTVWGLIRRRQGFRKARIQRLIFLGLDGLDPRVTEKYMSEGKLPNLSRLKEQGSYRRLRTTFPPQSPVAWSTFATGVSPAKHNIFDFLNRDLKSCVPELSSAKVRPPRHRFARPSVEMRRKSQSFWKILGEHAISSTIVRVPITFPPEKFEGRVLSAMCTPDLRGTQGSFSQFTTRLQEAEFESGSRYPLQRNDTWLCGTLEGPEKAPSISFRVKSDVLEISGQSHRLTRGEYSPWIKLRFGSVHGIARFLVTETSPEFSVYVTPIQIDPESPALPISHPSYYSAYLAKLLGSYATVGMAEDTWALNEGVIDDAAFLEQSYLTFAERERMFENALAHTPRGVVACVFDTSDRVQHMFHRDAETTGVIEDLYRRMDALVGRTMAHLDANTWLFVLSDHGFCSFRRAVNLNTWLSRNGYLALHGSATESGRYFEGVDWSRTRAYCLGLSGLYLNVRGREANGIVAPGSEAAALCDELAAGLSGLRDGDHVAIREAYATSKLYRGPYLDAAPDLVIGYEDGYRTSWDAAVGKVSAEIFEDNHKAWSGDHCVDPHLVPGVLFSSRFIDAADPGIEDMAPTALQLFGLKPPSWMDGKPILA